MLLFAGLSMGQDLVFFDGAELGTGITLQTGWSGFVEISDEEDAGDDGFCIKLTTGAGWDGLYLILEQVETFDTWSQNTLSFKILYDPELVGDLTLWFLDLDEDGAAKDDYPFAATYYVLADSMDDSYQWIDVDIPLSEFDLQNGLWDNDLGEQVAGTMDTTLVERLQITGMGQTEWEGNIIFLDEIQVKGPSETSVDMEQCAVHPNTVSLAQNYPNPFNPTTQIVYHLPVDGFVYLTVFDLLGWEVRVLVNENQFAGNYSAVFDASGLVSGIYFYRLETAGFTSIKKMILVE